VDGLPLAEAIPAELVAPPPVDVGADDSPVAALVDAATLARLGIAPGQAGRLTVGGRTIAVRAAGPAEMVPGADANNGVVIVDRAAADVALPDAARDPVVLYARAGPGAESAIAAEVGRFAPAVVLASRAAVLRELRAAPLGVAARAGFGAAIAVALLYAVAVVAFAARQAISARRREMAVLVALGLPSRGLAGMLVIEIVPLMVAALAAGIALGGLVAALVVPDLALGRLVGKPGPVALAIDPRLFLAFGAAPIAGAATALVAGTVSLGHSDVAAATRAVEA
jgi:putative ABC transport system permease protein